MKRCRGAAQPGRPASAVVVAVHPEGHAAGASASGSGVSQRGDRRAEPRPRARPGRDRRQVRYARAVHGAPAAQTSRPPTCGCRPSAARRRWPGRVVPRLRLAAARAARRCTGRGAAQPTTRLLGRLAPAAPSGRPPLASRCADQPYAAGGASASRRGSVAERTVIRRAAPATAQRRRGRSAAATEAVTRSGTRRARRASRAGERRDQAEGARAGRPRPRSRRRRERRQQPAIDGRRGRSGCHRSRATSTVERRGVGAAGRLGSSGSSVVGAVDLFEAGGRRTAAGRHAARRAHAPAHPRRGRRAGPPARRRARRCAGWSTATAAWPARRR